MSSRVVVIGAGITGITVSFVLKNLRPSLEIVIVDSGSDPTLGDAPQHLGATLGFARDARHLTGTEGLSFQTPAYLKHLFDRAGQDSEGWRTISVQELTDNEKLWLNESAQRYRQYVGWTTDNPYDRVYTMLNYGGIAVWRWLSHLCPKLRQFKLSDGSIYVAFQTLADLQADLESESFYNPYQRAGRLRSNELSVHLAPPSAIQDNGSELLALTTDQILAVPGSVWAVKSMWNYCYKWLLSQPGVQIHWNTEINDLGSLPYANGYVWADNGSAFEIATGGPLHRVQGIGGYWTTLPNPGFRAPFKVSAPSPNGYMNFTPVGDLLHVSGGFGFVGERPYAEAIRRLQPIKDHFIKAIAQLLNMAEADVSNLSIDPCIRPVTPTGLPNIKSLEIDGHKHISLAGAGKAGTTMAALLALHCVAQFGGNEHIEATLARHSNDYDSEVINVGLSFLHHDLELPIPLAPITPNVEPSVLQVTEADIPRSL